VGRVVRVLPDGLGIDKEFDYLVPEVMGDQVRVGTMVRVPLHGRRVGGWVVADDVTPSPGRTLLSLAKVSGWGPSPDVVDLAGWAAWRWVGRRASFLKTASPPFAVRGLPRASGGGVVPAVDDGLVDDAFTAPEGRTVLRLPPAADLLPVVLAAARRGPALVVTPSAVLAASLAARLRQGGVTVAVVPREWAQAAAGAQVVIGARAAAWAPVVAPAAVVVLDGHDEGLAQEQAPTWNGLVVAGERARRAGVPCVMVSSCPTVELLGCGRLLVPSRQVERSGWAPLEVLDRRRDDPRSGLYSPRLVGLLRGEGRVVCVLNRKGRARLLACGACGELSRCEVCGAAVGAEGAGGAEGGPLQLVCRRCGTTRPPVCLHCGSTRLKLLRVGVSRAREELAALSGRPVGEVTGETGDLPDAPILVGTEAVLHRTGPVDGVAFLEFDQELLAPRYRAAEEALALLARASRLVGGRHRGGRVLVQTRVPHHEVLQAALTADPGRLAVSEAGLRVALALPPERALALVSGEAADAFVSGLKAATPSEVEILGPDAGRWLVRAADHASLSAALAAVPRPAGRLRVAVDPGRI
jgi:primosomal protein N' (replication factor Y) (superfamily II helicase)